ncbi:hypothetical protein M089_5175, partial [Bacteroides ovatus str. 3725 D9 iii]
MSYLESNLLDATLKHVHNRKFDYQNYHQIQLLQLFDLSIPLY